MLTSRDQDLIRHVFRHRFLRSTHLLSLTSGSRQQVLRRLQLLYHNGYLDRPRAQIDYYRAGSRAMVYALGNKGMRLLEPQNSVPHRKMDWTARNGALTRFFMEHALAVADVMVKFEICCRQHQIGWIHLASEKQLKWTVKIQQNGVLADIGVVPDAIFGFKTNARIRWFFLEADRATMPVERKNLNQTSFARKLLAYHQTWRQQVLKDSFPRFQVLVVTTTAQHARNLLAANRPATGGKGSRLFLFIDNASLLGADDVLKTRFVNGCGESVTLLD
jgi:hypothetical protein